MQDFQPNAKYGRDNPIMNSLIAALSKKERIKIANYYADLSETIDTAHTHLLSLGQRIYRGGDANKGMPACLACHGPAGLGNPSAGFPRLSGQHARYIVTQLKAFRDGMRNNDKFQMMPIISKKMNDTEIIAVANYISALSKKERIKIANYYADLSETIDTAHTHLLSLGQRIYRGGDANKGMPACLACHGPAGLGNPSAGFPRLSGQHARYIVTQLKAFRDGMRNNDKFQMMPIISKKMNDTEIIAVANYISGLYS
ncbi:hypothetical protein FQR65_LT15629 [Abscondita terminalis]|nr:hypothetical protein FQR65_LT15629 [Abscondita terminalis]